MDIGDLRAKVIIDTSSAREAERTVRAAFGEMNQAAQATAEALRHFAGAQQAAARQAAQLADALQGAGQAERRAADAAENFGRKMQAASGALEAFGSRATRAGQQLSLALTVPLVALAKQAIQTEASYEDSMNRLQGATGANAAQMAVLSQKATALGRDLTLPGTSAVTAGQAMLALAQAGLNVRDIFDASLPTMRLSAATHVDNAKAAEILAVTLNEFGLSGKAAANAADLLTAAGNRTVGGVSALYEGLRKAGPALHELRVPLGDTVTTLALLNQAGLKGGEAGTALRGVFSRLVDPAKKAAAVLAEQGIHLFDASGKMKSMAEIAQILHDRLGKLTDQQRLQVEHTLGQQRAMTVLAVLARNGAAGFEEMAKKTDRAGEAARQAQKQMEGLPGALKTIQTAFTAASQAAIAPLSADLTRLGKALGELLTRFSELPVPTRKLWVEIAAGVAIAGPLLYILGQFALALRALVPAFTLARTAALATSAALGGPVALAIGAAVVAVGLLVTAWVRDWGDIQEKTRAAWKTISDGVSQGTSGIRSAWEGIAGPVKSATAGMMADIHTALETAMPGITGLWDRFVGYLEKRWDKGRQKFQQEGGWTTALLNAVSPQAGTILHTFTQSQVYQQNLAAEEARKRGMTGVGNLREIEGQSERIYGPFLPPDSVLGPSGVRPAFGGGGQRDPKLDAALHAGTEKLTPLQKEQRQYAEQLAQAHVRLAEVLAGEDNVTARLQAHYHLLHLSGRDDLVVTEQRIRAVEKHTAEQRKFHDALEAVNAKIRDLTTYHGAAKIEHDFPGTTTAQRKTYQEREAYAAHLKELGDASKKAEEEDTRSVTKLTDKLRELDQEYLKLTHSRERDQVAMQLNDKLYREEDQFHKNLIDKIVEHTRRNNELSASLKAEDDVFRRLHEELVKDRDERAKLFGTSRELTTAQQLLNEAWATGDDLLLQMALAMEDAAKETDRLKVAQDRAKEEGKGLEAGFQALFASLDRHRQAIVDLDLEYQKLTHGSLRDQVALNSEYKTTYDKLPAAIQAWVDAQVKGIEKIRKESEKLSFLRKLAEGTQQVFTQVFQNLAEHGFKGFFKNILDSFKQLLVQMAAEALAARLTNALFGKPDAQGNRGTQGKGGGGLMGLVQTGLQIYSASQGGPGGASGADNVPIFEMLAGGGPVSAGRPVIVGEHGPEMYIPRAAGTIMPHGQLAGATHHYNITFNVQTPDAAGFRRNQGAIMADMGRAIDRARRTHG